MLANYDRISKAKGTALARVKDQKCLACQMALRPQLWNQVRAGGDLIPCESCGRLLYYDDEHAISADPAPSSLKNKATGSAG